MQAPPNWLGGVKDGLWEGNHDSVLFPIVSKAKVYSKEGRWGRTWGREWAEPKERKHQRFLNTLWVFILQPNLSTTKKTSA